MGKTLEKSQPKQGYGTGRRAGAQGLARCYPGLMTCPSAIFVEVRIFS
jgi:hypothetical protein